MTTARRNPSSFLPWMLGPLGLQINGEDVDVERRETVNLVGTGITVEDDPDNETTNVDLSGLGGGGLGSFTSLELKTACSDETGSGALVFANTPTLVTPALGAATATSVSDNGGGVLGLYGSSNVNVGTSGSPELVVGSFVGGVRVQSTLKLADSNNSHSYIFSPANLVADRTISLPLLTGNDTMAVLGLAQTFSAAQKFSSYIQIQSTETGDGIQLGNDVWVVGARAAGGKVYLINAAPTNEIAVGNSANPAGTNVVAGTGFTVNIFSGSTHATRFGAALVENALPRVGLSSPYGSDGRATQATADSNQTLGASIYSRSCIQFTGANSGLRTMSFPAPANEDATYFKLIQNNCTGSGIRLSIGSGNTIDLAATNKALCMFAPTGVYAIASYQINDNTAS